MPPTTTIPDAAAYNWIISPAARCILAVGEGARIGGLLHRALVVLSGQKVVLRLAHSLAKITGQSEEPVLRLLASQPELTAWSKEILNNDLHEVNVSGIISLWASLEVAVEDTATLVLQNDVQSLLDLIAIGVKPPKGAPSPLDETTARRVFARAEQVSRGNSRTIAEAYQHILVTIGVPMSVEPAVLEKLTELNYVRNCLLHRGGVVDEKVAQEAPKLGLTTGSQVHIGKQDYADYFDAVGDFAKKLLSGAMGSRHARWKPEPSQ
ncbi:hypothetical protein [Aquabacterium sp.]|uniref:hypothetical protein n=1 Tax=Aquabacterium sp. TaxID=1872578 RepID=UPI003784105C